MQEEDGEDERGMGEKKEGGKGGKASKEYSGMSAL